MADTRAMEDELKRLEMEEELARLEAEEASEQSQSAQPSGLEQIETASRSLLEGISGGVSEPAISGVNAVLGNLIDSGFDAENLKDFFSKSIDAARISKEYERDIARRKGLEKALPTTAIAAEVAGAMTPFSAAGKIAKAATGATKILTKIPAIGGIASGAASAGLGALGSEALKQAVQIPTGVTASGETPSLGEVTATGAKIGAAIGAVPVVGKALAAATPRAMSAFGGVNPKVISEYLKRARPSEKVSSEQLKDAVEVAAQNVQDALLESRTSTADDLISAVTALKNKVISGSAQSFDILEKQIASGANGSIPFDVIKKSLTSSINELTRGKEALTPVRQSAADYMKSLLGRFEDWSSKGRVDLVTAKEMLQSLDEVTEYAQSAGQWSTSLDIGLQAVRKAIDEPLKKMVPEYKKIMEEVSSNRKLLKIVDGYFGEGPKALTNLERLVIGKDPYLNSAAQKLEAATEVPIRKGIDAVKTLKPVKNVMPDNTETFVKSVLSGRSPDAQKKLQILADFTEDNLMQIAEDAKLTQTFSSLINNGSRDVNFWKELLGTTAPYMAGGTVLGGPTGAVIGFMVKTFGAPTTKIILDGMLKVQGVPTVQKLNQSLSSVPPEVRQNLLNGFIRANVMRLDPSEPETMSLNPQEASAVYSEIKNSDLDAVTKANAMRSLSKDGTISTRLMKQYMAGMKAPRQAAKPAERKQALEQDRPDRLKK